MTIHPNESSSAEQVNHTLGAGEQLTTPYEFYPHGYPLGGLEYIHRHFIIAAIYIAISVVATVVGCLGNACVLLIIAGNKSMHNARNVFLVNLASADLMVTSIAIPFGILGE